MRTTYREGGGFEEAAAYSRAVRIGPYVAVSGTAPREPGGVPGRVGAVAEQDEDGARPLRDRRDASEGAVRG